MRWLRRRENIIIQKAVSHLLYLRDMYQLMRTPTGHTYSIESQLLLLWTQQLQVFCHRNDILIITTLLTADLSASRWMFAEAKMTAHRHLHHLFLLFLLSIYKGSSSFLLRKSLSVRSVSSLHAITQRQTALWDGSELESLNQYFQSHIQPIPSQTQHEDMDGRKSFSNLQNRLKIGLSVLVAGTMNNTQDRVVGILKQETITPLNPQEGQLQDWIQVDSNSFIYKDSMAYIPSGVTDNDAIQTLRASIVGVHCVFHPTILARVGGSSENMAFNIDGRSAVVLGGGDLACFISDALSILGAKVFQITNSKIGTRKLAPAVSIQSPVQRMGNLEVGFSASVGTFDVLVDCMSDESNSLEGRSIVLRELERRHGCQRYVSTFSHAQRIVRDEGLLFGPKMVDKYLEDAASLVSGNPTSSKLDLCYISPPVGFGPMTLQKLLNARLLFTQRQQFEKILYRNWSLKEFWELTSWPRDTSGGANLRFGLPITDDIERLLSDDAMERPLKLKKQTNSVNESVVEEVSETSNSFVTQISSLDELDKAVVSTKKTCLVFLSASYCRTCKALTPQYNRLARQLAEERNMDVSFVKADVSGQDGKMLSRALDVEAVPTFVMFRRGRLYGEQLSVSRIPSKKLDLAIEYLSEGKQWNKQAFETIDK